VLLVSRRSLDTMTPGDRQLLIDTARQSVKVMRALWDESENTARKAILAHGVQFNAVDMPAFRRAAQPLLDEYLRHPDLDSLYRRIRDLA
jgi:TRAP-type C4-dicarboxylate transport system substrate-binding protein